jgi:hypothetical protein
VDEALADEGDFLYEDGDDGFLADYADQVALAATQTDTNIPRIDASGEEPAE